MARHTKPLKSALVDSLLHLALVISILRIDLTQYLRHYSSHPEVQQIFMGQSVGLNIIDDYHHNQQVYPSKHADEVEQLYSELHSFNYLNDLVRSHPQYLSTWLVTDGSAPVQVAQPSATSVPDLTRQEAELIEQLWKSDLSTGYLDDLTTDQDPGVNLEFFADEDTGDKVFPPSPFDFGEEQLQCSDVAGCYSGASTSMAYNTQNSLEEELDTLSYLDPGQAMAATVNHSRLEPSLLAVDDDDDDDLLGPATTNSSGVFWGSSLSNMPWSLSRQTSLMNASYIPDLPELSAGHDLDIDPLDLDFENIYGTNQRDSISEDSAISLGGSSLHSLDDEDERLSFSSDNFDEYGAVGYTSTKTEPLLNNDFYDYEANSVRPTVKNVVYHDHTYGAPPGGVPHVRKMDIKISKEPSRGFAHDEILCRKLKIPFTVETIINSPVDEFTLLLKKHSLNGRQTRLVKDIRRRGKNKVAAQNCRQKRMDELSDLEGGLQALRTQKELLIKQKSQLMHKSSEIRKHIDIMSAEIFNTLRDENGMPYAASMYRLEVGTDGKVSVLPSDRDRRGQSQRKREKRRRRH